MLELKQLIQSSKNKPLIKVCGITQLEQANELSDIGIDFCGFIFYEKSKRFVTPHLTTNQIASVSNEIKKVGVFVNEKLEVVLQTANACKLDAIQLHGNETPEYCFAVKKHFFTIKAIGVNETVNINDSIFPYQDSVDAFLFDTKHETYGGTGKKFDWKIFENAKVDLPFFLSGGISPLDVGDLRHFASIKPAQNLVAFDINSKFENKYGVKDIKMIKNFVIEINGSK
ncbi:MAG: phosphoribosylanthranilate isomerase [Chitinophagaceae bacterium]